MPTKKSKIRNPKSRVTFVLGGARSGKSAFAEELAKRRGGAVLVVATGQALDDEMRERIAAHRAARRAAWRTLEAPRHFLAALEDCQPLPRVILLDCLTLWVTNELLADANEVERRLTRELDTCVEWARARRIDLILVSNEVGLGIVPENGLARAFRDILGRLNARAARHADQVFFMAAGLALELKARAAGSEQCDKG